MRTSSTWAQAAAAALLARRATQVDWMRSKSFSDYMYDYLSHSEAGERVQGRRERERLTFGLMSHWTGGERFVISPAAAAAAFSAAATLEGDILPPLTAGDLPSPAGLAVLPRSVYGMSDRGRRVGVSAFTWGPCLVGPQVPGTFQTTWTHYDADDDERLRAMRTARASMKRLAAQAGEEVELMSQRLDQDQCIPEQERAILRELLTRRKIEVDQTSAATKRADHQQGEYTLLDMQPLPFMHEFPTHPLSRRSSREQKTVSLDALDPDATSLVTRLPYAFWSLIQQSLLHLRTVSLTPRVERKYGHKRIPSSVIAVDAPSMLVGDDLITATKVRVVREDEGEQEREGFQWDLSEAIGGRAY